MATSYIPPGSTTSSSAIQSSSIPPSSKVYYGTVRSGQQLYAEKQSLVIFGSVNEGGEVLADGDIFVFGRLCGRVVAGLGGQTQSGTIGSEGQITHQIFATSFEPSLVGIGSVFVIPDDYEDCMKLRNKPVNISLQCEQELRSRVEVSSSNIVRVPCEVEGGTITMLFRPISL